MDAIPTASVDCIICDLPYGTTACVWDKRIPLDLLWTQYKRIIKKNGAIVLFGSQPFTSMLVMSNLEWFKYELIWSKGRGFQPQLANIQPMKSHENIAVFGKAAITYNPQKTSLAISDFRKASGKKNNKNNGYGLNILSSITSEDKNYTDRYPISVIDFGNSNQADKEHPTEKSQDCLKWLIRTYSNEGDLILDNCMGSGSTGEAALRESRRFIGMELYPLPDKPIGKDNPDYFDIAQKRLDNVARELRGEWKPLSDNGNGYEGLPMFEYANPD